MTKKLHHNFITVFLSLGSNQKFLEFSSEEILKKACDEISALGENFFVSSFVKSEPWGGVAQNIFVNAVCRLEISEKKYPEKTEEKFLDILQEIEKKFGRTRETHWGDRTLDIDILYFGTRKISRKRLNIPHPFIWERDFVFVPLREITTAGEYTALKSLKKNSENSLARETSFS